MGVRQHRDIVTYNPGYTMKSKLTLRMEEDVKERAKEIARERGTSVSKIVEDYFRLLLREPTEERDDEDVENADGNTIPDELPPRTQQMLEALGPATESLDLDADTRAWVDAAHEKHK